MTKLTTVLWCWTLAIGVPGCQALSGLQSQDKTKLGSLTAQSMTFDKVSNQMFLTGKSESSNSCLLVSVNIRSMKWEQEVVLADTASCPSSLALLEDEQSLILGGTSRSSEANNANNNNDYAFGMTVPKDSLAKSFQKLSTQPMDSTTISMATEREDDQSAIYVVTSKRTAPPGQGRNTTGTTTTTSPVSGDNYWNSDARQVRIAKFFSSSSKEDNDEPKWANDLATLAKNAWNDENQTAASSLTTRPNPKMHVGGLLLKADPHLVIVAGSLQVTTADNNAESRQSGYLTVLDPANGFSSDNSRNKQAYQNSQGDLVMGMCNDPHDDDAIILVGTQPKKGSSDGSMQAFAKKINFGTCQEVWSVSWSAEPSSHNDKQSSLRTTSASSTTATAYAVACEVHAKTVTIAGVVENGAQMVEYKNRKKISHGGDDLFVVQLERRYGTNKWMRQLGSPGDDRLSLQGGNNGMTMDHVGNPILFGDTTGSLFRQRTTTTEANDVMTDLMVFVLDQRDGSYLAMTQDKIPQAEPIAVLPMTPEEEEVKLVKNYVASHTFLIVIVCLIGSCLFCFPGRILKILHKQRRRASVHRRHKIDLARWSVYDYVQKVQAEDPFMSNDVQIQISEQGGWNVTYRNSVTNADNNPYLTSGLNDSTASLNTSFVIEDQETMLAAPMRAMISPIRRARSIKRKHEEELRQIVAAGQLEAVHLDADDRRADEDRRESGYSEWKKVQKSLVLDLT